MGVKIDLKGVTKKLSSQNLQRAQFVMANQMLVDTNENFVPMRDQHLRDSARVSSDGSALIWDTVYARRHYYNKFVNYTTPGTGPYWDLKAKGIFMSDWTNAYIKGAGL